MQGRKVNGECKAKVQVHDGSAFREITITSTESLLDVLDKVSKAIKRPSRTINLGYVAPWSMKIKSRSVHRTLRPTMSCMRSGSHT